MNILLLYSAVLLVIQCGTAQTAICNQNTTRVLRGVVVICQNVGEGYDWQRICGDGWTETNAKVVCRENELGYTGAVNTTKQSDNKPMDCLIAPRCIGTESTLAECGLGGKAESQLIAKVSCKCSDSEIRLVNGQTNTIPPNRATVQLCMDGKWATICGSSNRLKWTVHEANLVCRQLGYMGEGSTITTGCSLSLFTNADCTSTEKVFKSCKFETTKSCDRCQIWSNKRNDARVTCLPADCTNGEIRLVNGTTNREGRVEVCRDGRWGTVCNDNHMTITPGTVCTQMGFPAQEATMSSFGQGTGPVYSCSLNENNTFNCTHTDNVNCDHSMDLGVMCQTHQRIASQISGQCTASGGLGAFIGILVALLVAVVTAWIVSFILLKRSLKQRYHNTPTVGPRDEMSSNQLDNPGYEGHMRPHPQTYSSLGPTYESLDDNKGGTRTYDVIGGNQGNRNTQERNADSANIATGGLPDRHDYHVLESNQHTHDYHVLEQKVIGQSTPEGPTEGGDYETPISALTPGGGQGNQEEPGGYSKLNH